MKYGLLDDTDEQMEPEKQNVTSQATVEGMLHTESREMKFLLPDI
jgi:hypothetical protein